MVKIGWFIDSQFPPLELLCETPEPLDIVKNTNVGYKYCPAFNRYTSNTFVLRSPFTLHLTYKNNKIETIESSYIKALSNDILSTEPLNHWRNEFTPMFQIQLFQGFVADEEVWMEVTMPNMDAKSRTFPGRTIPGEFDIYSWQRKISYSFEWLDTSKDFIIEKGDPLYYIRFKSKKPSDTFKIIRIDETPELRRAIDRCSDSKMFYKDKSWNLMKINRKLRIKKFINERI